MRKIMRIFFFGVFFCITSLSSIFSICSFSESLIPDDNFPLKVESDSLNVNYGSQQGIYIGNVVADQGTRHLTADHVLLVRDSALKEFSEIHAFGNAINEAYIQLIPRSGDHLVKGVADEIIYHPIVHTMTFKGHVELEQEGRIYKGPLAIYNIETQIIDSPESSDERVTMIIPPDKKA